VSNRLLRYQPPKGHTRQATTRPLPRRGGALHCNEENLERLGQLEPGDLRRQVGRVGRHPAPREAARPLIPIDAFGSGTPRLLAASPHHVIAGPVLDQDRVRLFSRPELQAVALVSLDLADTGHKAAFG
jgi:hypothetical protein